MQNSYFSPLTNQIIGQTQEGRNIYRNEDGSNSSERSITVEANGRYYNIPTIYNGKELSHNKAFEVFKQNKGIDIETGKKLNPFNTQEEAVRHAELKSSKIRQQVNIMANPLEFLQQYIQPAQQDNTNTNYLAQLQNAYR
jgi:hypothetical protein